MQNSSKLRFALVAGEESGDILGADLMKALQSHFPNAHFEGIGGDRMKALGFKTHYPIERLSVMGLIEPLKKLADILSIRSKLKSHFLKNKPTVFIGIDAPDFNLPLAKSLKLKGIQTVHYVSPTVWAWRKGRLKSIKKAIDLMLALFPFEQKIYEEYQIPVRYVGHPLADLIELESDKRQARLKLNLPLEGKIVALLPGSREQELKYLAAPFIQTAKWLKKQDNSISFITASPNLERQQQFSKKALALGLSLQSYLKQAPNVMASADAVLVASGTATLQAMLIKRPTVIAYKMSSLVFALAKYLVKVPYIGLPNLLANECLMPEFIQSKVCPQAMGRQLLDYLHQPQSQKSLETFQRLHQLLKKDAGKTAALAVMELIS